MPRNCVNSPSMFCYICGEFTPKKQRKLITGLIKTAYRLYFGCKIGDQDKTWAPHTCCVTCAVNLRSWLKGTGHHMPFAVPMIWREPTDHVTDCYFCLSNISGISAKNKKRVVYPNVPSALRPVPHSSELPVPQTPTSVESESSDNEDSPRTCENDLEFEYPPTSEPHLITKEELNDLVRDLNLPKNKAELLASRLKGWNLLCSGVNITYFRQRQNEYTECFSSCNALTFCNDIDMLLNMLGCKHNPAEWRLFIDSSKTSLKAVLLHNGKCYPSIPVAHSTSMKETYENLKIVLQKIKYDTFQWHICSDLKVTAILLGLQTGYTKYCCFLCEWDSRARKDHYVVKQWPVRRTLTPGEKNVILEPLVPREKIYLPPLHIKLGLMKNLVKAMNREQPGFQYLRQKFPRLSDAKLKEGIFVGPQIKHLLKDSFFESTLNEKELSAWKHFKLVTENFLGNVKSPDYKKIVASMVDAYHKMGCNMSLKIHFLHSHVDFFPENLGAVSDEHGERFHQDIANIELRYKGKWTAAMLADYCWGLQRETPQTSYKRKASGLAF